MKPSEIILLIISGLSGKVSSKTKIHKLCYFYSIITGKDLGFRPHYYGPYSPLIERSLDELEGIGLLEKNTSRFGGVSNGFEVVRYDYTISKYGSQVLEKVVNDPDEKSLKRYVKAIENAGNPDYLDLSIAAKAHFVLESEGQSLTPDEIRKKAKEFGWNISANDIEKAVKLLEKLDLIKC